MAKRSKPIAPQKCPLGLIEWVDAVRPQSGWIHLADFDPGSEILCASVGWLVHDGADFKALAPNLGHLADESQAQTCGIIRIPTCTVRSVAPLVERKRC